MPADDPTERFDLYDASGHPLGVSKARSLVHRDGDWHKSVHIWVVLLGAEPSLVLQRRSLRKDSHPGAVDVSVAGHLRAGESIDAALRESEEEIGLPLHLADVTHLGTRRKEDHRGAMIDRELQEVFLAQSSRAFEELRPDPYEVAGVLSMGLSDARALFDGASVEVPAHEIRAAGGEVSAVVLHRSELLQGGNGYFAHALRVIERRLAGDVVELETFV